MILSMLFELREERELSIVLITHEQDIAKRCDTTYTLHNGILSKSN